MRSGSYVPSSEVYKANSVLQTLLGSLTFAGLKRISFGKFCYFQSFRIITVSYFDTLTLLQLGWRVR